MSSFSASTVAALATPPGVGGISVIRISGPRSLAIATAISQKREAAFKPRYATSTPLFNQQGDEIDEGIITYFPAPHSYTGEHVVEISSHGGWVVPKTVLTACFSFGCERAAPGEFTKRAFMNGKMDLSQAEAVADLISAKTEIARATSYKIMSGRFTSLVEMLRQQLIDLLSVVEAELDFESTEVPELPPKERVHCLNSVLDTVNSLLETYKTGRRIMHGALVVIVGHPNVGKSSLLNAILSEERVIVSETPGTTRDAVEVQYQIDGMPVQIIDTVGERDTKSIIEARGHSIAQSFISKADLLLWVSDNTTSPRTFSQSLQSPLTSARLFLLLIRSTFCLEKSVIIILRRQNIPHLISFRPSLEKAFLS